MSYVEQREGVYRVLGTRVSLDSIAGWPIGRGYRGSLPSPQARCLQKPRHPEYKATKAWMESMTGDPFDPDALDVEAVNAALRKQRSR